MAPKRANRRALLARIEALRQRAAEAQAEAESAQAAYDDAAAAFKPRPTRVCLQGGHWVTKALVPASVFFGRDAARDEADAAAGRAHQAREELEAALSELRRTRRKGHL